MSLALAAVAAAIFGGGCITIQKAEFDATAMTTSDATSPHRWDGEPWASPAAWPARVRVRSGLRPGFAETGGPPIMGVITETPGPIVAMHRGPQMIERIEDELLADFNTFLHHHHGAFTAGAGDQPGSPVGDARPVTTTLLGEGRGSFVFIGPSPDGGDEYSTGPDGMPAFWLKFISGELVGSPTTLGADHIATINIQRTWFAFYEPAEGRAPRGLCVVMPGMFGTPIDVVDKAVAMLRDNGWCVLRMLAHPSRFTEQTDFTIDIDNDMTPAAIRVADVLTDRAAECAYAVQAAVAKVREMRPGLTRLPRVLMGMSGGALVLPTVMAREPDAYAGAVVIAGGADFLRVAIESNYSSWINATRFHWREGGESVVPSPAVVRSFETLYRQHAPLDTTFTGSVLTNKRVLFIHGSGDEAVPAALGDELWAEAGRPERWVFGTGHELLFFFLPWHLDHLAQWLDEQFPRPAPMSPSRVSSGADATLTPSSPRGS